ncbi:hypothetical protein STPYR_10327 [uncultured Stenotrophomonas sp.]|uniref:X-Tfes XVIPCD domain-containing protein n=1 Tax=uncultured Stenotrophomonas sp. TaxID=165438 RepID=A0A1Y5Q6L3_9GAMM|nr:hypothetical protein STPYR_10327 [uncultured Stenotrophomonas sp.]
MAGAIASAMTLTGGKQVDHVVLSRDASQVFGVQGAIDNPASLCVAPPTMTAMNTLLEHSNEQASQHALRQAMVQEQQHLQQEESRNYAMRMA